jgi:hypothetical protein
MALKGPFFNDKRLLLSHVKNLTLSLFRHLKSLLPSPINSDDLLPHFLIFHTFARYFLWLSPGPGAAVAETFLVARLSST